MTTVIERRRKEHVRQTKYMYWHNASFIHNSKKVVIQNKDVKDPSKPGFFLPDVWKIVLSCFSFMEAMNIDFSWGWIDSDYLTDLVDIPPSPEMWNKASSCGSIGALHFLQESKMPCPQVTFLCQNAADMGHIMVMEFFLVPEYTFFNTHRSPIIGIEVPYIDNACTKGILPMVAHLSRRSRDNLPFFKDVVSTLENVIRSGNFLVLKEIVPSLTKVVSSSIIELGIAYKRYKMVEYCIRHLDKNLLYSFPSSWYEEAARTLSDKAFLLLTLFDNNPPPEHVLDVCFYLGNIPMFSKLVASYPSYKPSKEVVIQACQNNQTRMIDSLPKTHDIPLECFEIACGKGNSHILFSMKDRNLVPEYKDEFFKGALHSRSSDSVIALYHIYEGFEVHTTYSSQLASRNMRDALIFLANNGHDVYTRHTLLSAIRAAASDIISDVLNSGLIITPELDEDVMQTFSVAIHPKADKKRSIDVYIQNRKRKAVSNNEEESICIKKTKT
jgi:hypothetical protein